MSFEPTLTNTLADAHLLLAFEGEKPPRWVEESLQDGRPAGFTLFRGRNLASPAQAAELTIRLQHLNRSELPLLIAADQEGGQLQALPGSTPFAGNMALGATGDEVLTRRVGQAIGTELKSVGINLNYSPSADVATLAHNPSLGIRSFGSDPSDVGRLAVAMAAGMRDAGILATAKHFPGKGEAAVDPHHELPLLNLSRDRLDQVELAPFRDLFTDGIPLVMVGHYLVPGLTGSPTEPVSVSRQGLGAIRTELGFSGVIVTDALDMGALDQGAAQVVEFISMVNAGVDLFLCMPDPDIRSRAITAIDLGHARGLIEEATLQASRRRIDALRHGLELQSPEPEVVANADHLELAVELAERSITLVKDQTGSLPIKSEDRVVVLEPKPEIVTPADTMDHYPPVLAEELRAIHGDVTPILYRRDPSDADIAELVRACEAHDVVVVATDTAGPQEARLVNLLIQLDVTVVAVAVRTPFDLEQYPEVPTYACTYSAHRPSMSALAGALVGKAPFPGRLPVPIADLFPLGHGS